LRICLLWHSLNSSNYGVGALTESHLRLLRGILSDAGITGEFVVVGWSDPLPNYISASDTSFVPFGRKFLFARKDGFYELVRRCDLVLDIAAGDSFTDIYGARRFWFQVLSKAVVLAARRPLVLSPQTIGPFTRWWSIVVAKQVMKKCTAIVSRDRISTSVVQQFNVSKNLVEATDVAFRLPYKPSPKNGGTETAVGINVSGLLYAGGYRKKNDFSLSVDYASLIHNVIKWFSEQDGCVVHLVSHVFVPEQFEAVEDDYRVSIRLADKFDQVTVAPKFRSPSEAKSYISGMDFFCGSRMHACIAAFSSGVPTVPLAYSRKFVGLFETLGFEFVADCTKHDDRKIMEIIQTSFREREGLRNTIAQCNRDANQKLGVYEDMLRNCFIKIIENDRLVN